VKTFGRFSSRRRLQHQKNISGQIDSSATNIQPALNTRVLGSRRMGCISDF
jgi:hypothetical protein